MSYLWLFINWVWVSNWWLISSIDYFFLFVWTSGQSWISEPWVGCNLLFRLEWYTFRLGVTHTTGVSRWLSRDFSEFYPTPRFLFLLKSAAPYSCKRGPPFMMSWWLFFFIFFFDSEKYIHVISSAEGENSRKM